MTSPDDLRIGDTERDAVATALHDHFAQGRLTREELEERLDTTLAAKTRADLREVAKDLPGPNGLPEPVQQTPPWAPGPHRVHRHHRHRHGPPIFPLLFVILMIAVFSGGAGWFIAAKVFFLVWLATAFFGFMRVRRWRRARM